MMCIFKCLKNIGPGNIYWGCVLLLLLSPTLVAKADQVLYLPFEDAVNPIDASANPAAVVVHGSLNSVDAKLGKGLEFNGNNANRIEVTHATKLDGMSALTIAAWVLPRNIASHEGMSIVSKRITTGDADSYNLFIWTGQHVEARVNYAGIIQTTTVFEDNTWYHVTLVFDGKGNAGEKMKLYVNGVLETSGDHPDNTVAEGGASLWVGDLDANRNLAWDGVIDEVRLYNHALSEVEILGAMAGKPWPYAFGPNPSEGTLHSDTWLTLSWKPGELAVSHDVYLGDNAGDVNEATQDSDLFRGNQANTFLVAGFPGFAYPDGLVPGTTYYWRIDEVNDAEPNSPWKGDIWSFSIPPKTAYYPAPAEGAEFVELDVKLNWTAGFGTKLHYIVFGEDFDDVSNAAAGIPHGSTTYNPGPLSLAKTYFWRVDEFDGVETHKGEVWSFTTLGAASSASPANGAVDVKPTAVLSWDAGAVAASHEVYFGSDLDAVKNATKASPEYKGTKALGEESYDPGKLMLNTAYYWRIEEVNSVNPDSPWAGTVWSFTTGDFFVIDDFEEYDAGDNQIWYSWHDGLGYGTPGTADYFAGNGTGATVGDETTASYTEETIVHGGGKSMPVAYDNNKQGYSKYSQVDLTLTAQRNWTEEGMAELSLWFYGDSANAAEPLYVAVSNNAGTPAVMVHDDPAAATISSWTQWIIPLQAFADKGINLSNVDRITIGLGTQGNIATPGGSGKMYFDDIRLYQPQPQQ